MTAFELRAIVAAHRESLLGGVSSDENSHRGALLAFLRDVAVCFRDGDGFYREDTCQFCGAIIGDEEVPTHHAPECLVPVLEVLR